MPDVGLLIEIADFFEVDIREIIDGQRKSENMDKEKETLETEIGDLKVLKDEIQPYFDEVKKLQKTRKEINVEELSSEKVGELLAAV